MTLFKTIYEITRHECSDYEIDVIRQAFRQHEINLILDAENKAEMIINAVCKHNEVTPEQLKGKNRERKFADLRTIIFYKIRQHTGYSFMAIGKMFNRNHATVIACLKKYKQLENNNDFRLLITKSGFEY